MGFYIETSSNKNKAQWLVDNAKGTIVNQAVPTHDSIPVVVLDNGLFEAAGIAFDESELAEFTRPQDRRRRTIVMVPRDQVIRYRPEVGRFLKW